MAENPFVDLVPGDFFIRPASEEREREIPTLSVSEFLSKTRLLIEEEFPYLGIKGEVSSISIPRSGHAYFCIKDSESQLKAVMFQGARLRNRYFPEEGEEVVIFGRPSVYRPRGDLQVIVERICPYGEGRLERQFNALKEKLQKEGLFSPEHKKEIPRFPVRVFLVTSPTGAAVRDFLRTAQDRLVMSEIILCPTRVQGDGADEEIVEAIKLIEEIASPEDVLVVTRGGGSREDLWTFNSELLARHVFQCEIPTVSAIGHEIDFTILDFVADLRAQTPTAAAQLLFPEREEYVMRISHLAHRLQKALSYKIIERKHHLKDLAHRIKDPTTRLYENRVKLDEVTFALERNIQRFIERERTCVLSLGHALSSSIATQINGLRERLARMTAALDALSPLQVLSRGYSIVMDEEGRVIKHAHEVMPNQVLRIHPKSGKIICIVKEVEP